MDATLNIAIAAEFELSEKIVGGIVGAVIGYALNKRPR